MRSASSAMKALLSSRQPVNKADLITCTTTDGVSDYWTTFSENISYGGTTWISGGPLVSRSTLSVRNTAEIPELDLTFKCSPATLFRGLPFRQQIASGTFNGAMFKLERAFMPLGSVDTSAGLILMFLGRKGPVKQTGDLTTITVRGGNVSLKQPAPKNCFQKPCLHTFCDAGCTLNEADFTTTNTIGDGSDGVVLYWGTSPVTPANYVLGKITMTSGASQGQVRTIRKSTATTFLISYPFDNGISAGDSFDVMEGCVKTTTRCTALGNLQHFRGFPYIPDATFAA